MESTCLDNPQAANGHISRDTNCNSKQNIVKVNEHPEWLPAGWRVDVRTRKSGAHMGSEYKCYIEPSNGHKFYSKPEVLRYLETLKGNSCTSKKEKICTNLHSPSKDVVQTATVEDLPPGWIKEVRVRKGNGSRKDPYYIDPVSGYEFRSKKDALRYLKSGDIRTCVFKPYKRGTQDEHMFTTSPMVKRQKLKKPATRRQHFTGKAIYDKSSLESPDGNKKVAADIKMSAEMMVVPVPTSETVVKMHSQGDRVADPPEMNEKSSPGRSALLKIESLKEPDKMFSTDAGLDFTPTGDVLRKDCIVNEENGKTKNHSNAKKKLSVHHHHRHRFSKRLAGIEPSQEAGTVGLGQALQAPNRYLRKSRRSTHTDLANKSSQQLNVVSEIENVQNASCMNMPMQGESLNKSDKPSEDQGVSREQHQLEREKIDDNKLEQLQYCLSQDSSSLAINVAKKTIITGESPLLGNPRIGQSLASEASALKENKLDVKIGKIGHQKIYSHSNKSSHKKDQRMPCRASKRLAGFEPELMNNSIYSEKPPEYKSRKSKNQVNTVAQQSEDGATTEVVDHYPVNRTALIKGESSKRSRKPPTSPDIADKQVEQVGDEEIYDESSASHLPFAFHYSWSDPCLEFAIKTLTGVLPIENTVGDDLTLVPETGVIEKNNLSGSCTESTSYRNPQVNLKKHKNKKELRLPRRLSKRLTGHEPDLLPAERPLEYAARKSYKDMPKANVLLNSGASEYLDTSNEEEHTLRASDSSKGTGAHGELLNMVNEVRTICEEQLQKLEAEKIVDQNSNVNLNYGASQHLSTSKETEHSVRASHASETREHGERLYKSEKSHESQTVLKEQLQPFNKSEKSHESQTVLKEQLQPFNESEKSHESQTVLKEQLQSFNESEKSHESQTVLKEQLQPFNKSEKSHESQTVLKEQLQPFNKSEKSHESQTVLKEQLQPINESEKSHESQTVLKEQLQPFNESEKSHESQTVLKEQLQPVNKGEKSHESQTVLKEQLQPFNKSEKSHESQTVLKEQLQPINESEKSHESQTVLKEQLQPFNESEKSHESQTVLKEQLQPVTKGEKSHESQTVLKEQLQPFNKSEKSHESQTVLKEQLQPFNKSEKSYEAQSVPEEQLQKPEAEKIGDRRSVPQLPLLFGDSWSDDPCLEFAFKTLTGALPVEDGDDVLPVMSPSVSAPPNQVLLESMMEKGMNEVHDNSNQSKNKTDFNMVWEPSKRNLGQPELRTSSLSCERASNIFTRESYCDQAYNTRNLDEGNSLNTEGGNMTQLNHHSRNMDVFRHEEQPTRKAGQVLEDDVPAEQSQLETLTNENPESHLCAPFMDSWSDSCLQFAFKTLSGAIPVEENLAKQENFQGPANCSGQGQRDGDISSHHDMGEKSIPGKQSSMSSFIPSGKCDP